MYTGIKRTGTKPVLKQNQWNDLEYLTFPQLTDTGIVTHAFSTRLGGVSTGIYSSMNLSYSRGDDKAHVEENYRRMANVLGTDCEHMICSDQTHTTNIRLVTEADAGKGICRAKDYTDIDGLITNVPGLVLATFYADCVPLYFVDPVHRAIGLSHSGWRGTVSRMGKYTIEAMGEAFGSEPSQMIAAIGPSICVDCYEVSEDVAQEFYRVFPEPERQAQVVKPGKTGEPGKYQLDLWRANELILQDAGIPASQISVTDICTCCNSEYLFSHRASHGKRGNLGAFLGLR